MAKYLKGFDQTFLKSVLSYDQLSGIWTWLVEADLKTNIGDTAGSVCPDGYLVIGINNKIYRAHRLAWLYMTGEWPEFELDHENRIRNDCRWVNIREASRQQNMRNATVKSNNKSGIKGIRRRHNKWESRIKVNGKAIALGSFSSAEEAHLAYLNAANFYFGKFATSGKIG